MSWSMTERWWLARTAEAVGPDAPTLCAGWDARRLLGHLVLRERRPWAMGLDLAARRPPGEEPQLSRLLAETPYEGLLELFRGGPPMTSPTRLMGDRANLVEFVVHHEDLRRAGEAPLPPRERAAAFRAALWSRLLPLARVRYLRCPVGVVLVVPGGPRAVVHRGARAVAVLGDPVELALHALGRTAAARVELRGDADALAAYARR